MEDSYILENCSEQDVFIFGSTTLKADKLKKEISQLFFKYKLGEQLTNSLSSNLHLDVRNVVERSGRYVRCFYDKWFDDGVDCEILKLGAAGWQKGKIKIKLNVSLEFCPDELEVEKNQTSNEQGISELKSPLDDIRLMIKNV